MMKQKDAFRMPAEYETHRGTIMIFPERPGSWPYEAKPALPSFQKAWEEISKSEELFLVVSPEKEDEARKLTQNLQNVTILPLPQNDAWARDTGPTFVKSEDGAVHGIDWDFNAWGGSYDGLYQDYTEDNALASEICKHLAYPMISAKPFVLEGGSIHSDGEGTLLVTERCLLSEGRNPNMSKKEIEDTLCSFLGVKKILWLPYGIYQDETNEHVDNVCAFIRPAEVVLAWCDDPQDPQYEMSRADLEYLQNETDAKGRKLKIHKLPIPKHPVCITQKDLDGYVFAEGEDTREVGERLAASYVNFYFTNTAILLPQFGGENAESDCYAKELLETLCPERKIIPIAAREWIVGGGNIHCLTQQIPK